MSRKDIKRSAFAFLAGTGLIWFLLYRSDFRAPDAGVGDNPPLSKDLLSKSESIAFSTPETDEASRQKVVSVGESMLMTPIVFYGKVVDQDGDPVPDANVGYGLLDKFNESGSVGKSKADSRGSFQISGVRGAVISVSVYKDGYHFIEDLSKGSFAYGYGTDVYTKPPPTKDDPAIFVLHRLGTSARLVKISSRQFEIPKNGGKVSINLSDAGVSNPDLVITSTVGEMVDRRYDWKYELIVPEGGIIVRSGGLKFEAPEGGFPPTFVVSHRASDADWKNGAELSFFLKVRGGRFARINARFYPRDYRNLVVLESHLNPEPGNRNLVDDLKVQP